MPYFSSAMHQAASDPGAATAFGPTRFSCSSTSKDSGLFPGSGRYIVGVPAAGTMLCPSITTCRPSAVRIWHIPPPISPTIIGSTTVSANCVATAASIALPPAASISAPAAEASGWLLVTIPRLPVAGCFCVVNGAPAWLCQVFAETLSCGAMVSIPPNACRRFARSASTRYRRRSVPTMPAGKKYTISTNSSPSQSSHRSGWNSAGSSGNPAVRLDTPCNAGCR